MAVLTDAARDAGTSGVGSCRQIASVRFSDSQASQQCWHCARCASIFAHTPR